MGRLTSSPFGHQATEPISFKSHPLTVFLFCVGFVLKNVNAPRCMRSQIVQTKSDLHIQCITLLIVYLISMEED